jgi:hypothetical protein
MLQATPRMKIKKQSYFKMIASPWTVGMVHAKFVQLEAS